MAFQPQTRLSAGGKPVDSTNPLPVTDSGSAAGIGAPADAAASTDTGTFSLVSLVKRGLQSLTSLVGQKAATPAVLTNALAITRPADTTAYALGDLVANSTTAGSVVPLTFANAVLAEGSCVRIERVRLYKSSTSTTNASFRLHLFNAAPTGLVNGDNGAFSCNRSGYIGAFDITVDRAFVDAAQGAGVSLTGSPVTAMIASGTTLYGLLEARAAYTPGSAETINAVIEAYRF
jgi:hypothetical protein